MYRCPPIACTLPGVAGGKVRVSRLAGRAWLGQAGLAGCCLPRLLAANPCCCFTQQPNFWPR